ncbi:thermonuclease family protein [Bacillus songklensis]|uniref:Thermonuclease family protein n=1 Tax=Bacillus songklensis TaxID=1069116 RepID=A0ABV8BA81_9BACI
MKIGCKLLISITMTIFLSLGLTACNSSDINNRNNTDSNSKEITETATTQSNNTTTSQTNVANSNQETHSTADKHQLTNPNGVALIPAMVTNVIDGDTLDVKINGKTERVRLVLVDTPETKHPNKPVQPFGPEASELTKNTLLGKQVGLEKDISERDRYGRILAYVWVDGKMHNEALIEKGLGRVAVFPPDTKYVDEFREKQRQAQEKAIGIWSIENYVQENGFQSSSSSAPAASKQSNTTTASQPSQSQPVASAPSANTLSNTGTHRPFQNDPSDDVERNTSCAGKIKGNTNSKIYHVPGGAYYDKTVDNITWFCSEAEAQAAGYRKSKR